LWVFLIGAICGHAACLTSSEKAAAEKTGGNPRGGIDAIRRYGCPSCHIIPGIDEALGRTGPSLNGVANRARIADALENTPENLIRWVRDPRSIDLHTSMPTMQISESDAHDIAAYLYTLR